MGQKDNKNPFFFPWQHHTCTNQALRTLQHQPASLLARKACPRTLCCLGPVAWTSPSPSSHSTSFPVPAILSHSKLLHSPRAHPEPSFSHTLGDGNKTNKCCCGAKKNISAILLFPPGLITRLSKHPVLTSYSMHTLPGSPRSPSPAQGTLPNPSGKPGCSLLAAKGWTLQRAMVPASLAISPDALLRWQVKGLHFWKPSGQEDRRGARQLEALLSQIHPAGPQPPSLQPLLPPATQLCPQLLLQTAATVVPIAHHLPCCLTASNSSTSLWTTATALSFRLPLPL